jgi:hypothetical protein
MTYKKVALYIGIMIIGSILMWAGTVSDPRHMWYGNSILDTIDRGFTTVQWVAFIIILGGLLALLRDMINQGK